LHLTFDIKIYTYIFAQCKCKSEGLESFGHLYTYEEAGECMFPWCPTPDNNNRLSFLLKQVQT